ncbi:hypothetical protein [Shewanella sp. 10N.286.48.A6]|uniref:hypothetical protein n=1 Tax=Shewanella sp. 10N.286.48.A6 TaxID=1880833 RepID=UPI000C857403|nr:hypothetical protein [Shewanella sp. 10N.286.48.A6]PMH96966.1 hypothetical protein BCU55_02535 [Shewanella sp. 10N.286.48.A6]
MFKRLTTKNYSSKKRIIEESIYEIVAEELSKGEKRIGLWTKAIGMSEGNVDKAESIYIQLRANSLYDEAHLYQESIEDPRENKRKLEKLAIQQKTEKLELERLAREKLEEQIKLDKLETLDKLTMLANKTFTQDSDKKVKSKSKSSIWSFNLIVVLVGALILISAIVSMK